MKAIISTGCLEGHSLKDVIRISSEHGLDGAEWLLCHSSDPRKEARSLGKHASKVRSVHMDFFTQKLVKYMVNPGRFFRKTVKEAVDVSRIVGSEVIVVHPMPAPLMKWRFRKSMSDTLSEYRGTGISLECLEVRYLGPFKTTPYSISDYGKLYDFAKERGLNLTLDAAHCASTGMEPKEFFERYGDIISNIHVSGYRKNPHQCHMPLSFGGWDMKGVFSLLRKREYKGLVTLEVNPTTRDKLEKEIVFFRGCLGRK